MLRSRRADAIVFGAWRCGVLSHAGKGKAPWPDRRRQLFKMQQSALSDRTLSRK